jgi:hypothetical protein
VPRAGAGRRSTGVALAALALVVAAAGSYWTFTRSPLFALWQSRRAMERHDLALFRTYVDVPGVSRALVDRAAAPVLTRPGGPTSPLGRAGRVIGQGAVAVMRLPMAEAIERALEALVATGQPPRDDDTRTGPRVRVSIRHVRSLKYLRQDGDYAYVGVGVEADPPAADQLVEFKLRRLADRWQVAEIGNGRALVHVTLR